MVGPVTQSWYKAGYSEQGGGGLRLKCPKLGTVSSSFLASVQPKTQKCRGGFGLSPGQLAAYLEAAHRGSHTFQVVTRNTSVLRFLSVSRVGHLRHVINCAYGANIQEEINSFKGA